MQNYPQRSIENVMCWFNPDWFKKYDAWLEYSIVKDAVFCFVCYLFKLENSVEGDGFVNEEFRTWNKSDAFNSHVGAHMSIHNQAMQSFNAFKNIKKPPSYLVSQSNLTRLEVVCIGLY